MASVNTLDMATALRHLRRADERFVLLIEQHGLPPLRRTRNSFRSLASSIIYQQLSGKAARTIHDRFVALFPGKRFPTPSQVLAMPLERLRKAGLSYGKASYLHDLALKFEDGTLQSRKFSRMSDEALAQALTKVKGIGPWTVDMFLIFAMNRPDVLPVGDLGVRKGFQQFFGLEELPAPEEMQTLAEPWRPYRSIGSWYMWRVIETELPVS